MGAPSLYAGPVFFVFFQLFQKFGDFFSKFIQTFEFLSSKNSKKIQKNICHHSAKICQNQMLVLIVVG
jgi:hypothetical protein